MIPGALLKIGELATQAAVSTRTIDYYTQLGLLSPSARSSGGFRLYAPQEVQRVHAIRALEAAGASLDDITSALGATGDTAATAARLHESLRQLGEALPAANTQAAKLAAPALERAHGLILAAIDILTALPPT